MLVGDDLVQVACDRAHIAVNGPFVVVQHDDQPLRLVGNVIQRFERNAVRESRIAGERDHVLLAASQITSDRHAQRS